MAERMNGRVKWFDSKKGYGFIEKTGEKINFFIIYKKIRRIFLFISPTLARVMRLATRSSFRVSMSVL